MTLGLTLIATLSLIQPAQAATPRTYGPRDTVRFERLSPAPSTPCRTVMAHRLDGSAKRREVVEVCESQREQVKARRWIGPRHTIPIYDN
ncbi:MAG: hypothetical protein VYC42_16050 [Pseudomonadota bacterium]|nr:hypothetical protein [Nevskiales bacterium]MEC9364731.1 hypothetical protein [Pseudomonadota bacterium]